jgi:hypothetical protein
MVEWMWHIVRADSTVAGWTVAGVLVVLIAVMGIGVVVLWPRSKRWGLENRVHRLAKANEASIRRGTRRALDQALRALATAKKVCRREGRANDAGQLSSLLHEVEVVRDQVACDYTPSVIDIRDGHFEIDLERLMASEVVRDCSVGLARRLHDGEHLVPDDLTDLRSSLKDLSREELALR